MEIYEYSNDEIEQIADAENMKYDPTRLTELKPLDKYGYYDYAERILGLNIDWKYLSHMGVPQSRLFYNDTIVVLSSCYVPKAKARKMTALDVIVNCKPYELFVKANTIIVDQSILDRDFDYEEKFCVLHECGHFVCHPRGFSMAACESFAPYVWGSMQKMTPQQLHEKHANRFAAAFLMPRDIITKTFNEMMESNIFAERTESDRILGIMEIMAKKCDVTVKSLSYRLNALDLIQICEV